MKKFFISLFILALFSGFVFYLGWSQIKVNTDEIGVVISKTNGIDENVIQPGKFLWHWQFLLPTNAELRKFKIKPVNVTKKIKGELPSGNLYTSIFNSKDNFEYEFDFSISLTVAPEAIIDLLKNNKVTDQDDFGEYLSRAADTIAQLSADFLIKKAMENSGFRVESVRRDDIMRAIQIYREFPEVELSSLSVLSSKIPDFSLYKQLQNQVMISQEKYLESTVLKSESEELQFEDEEMSQEEF